MLEVRFGIQLKYPGQPLLHAKPLFSLHNLLLNRRSENSGNYFICFLSYIVLSLLGVLHEVIHTCVPIVFFWNVLISQSYLRKKIYLK
jgi:hypothetical protein